MLHGPYARVSILRPLDGDTIDFEAGYIRHFEERAGAPWRGQPFDREDDRRDLDPSTNDESRPRVAGSRVMEAVPAFVDMKVDAE